MNIIKSSENLTSFYRAYLTWVEDGAFVDKLNDYSFCRDAGLCFNLSVFSEGNRIRYTELCIEMRGQLIDRNLCTNLPFNQNSLRYIQECDTNSCHTNLARIQWVKDRLKEVE